VHRCHITRIFPNIPPTGLKFYRQRSTLKQGREFASHLVIGGNVIFCIGETSAEKLIQLEDTINI
jgi:hypothetical protein